MSSPKTSSQRPKALCGDDGGPPVQREMVGIVQTTVTLVSRRPPGRGRLRRAPRRRTSTADRASIATPPRWWSPSSPATGRWRPRSKPPGPRSPTARFGASPPMTSFWITSSARTAARRDLASLPDRLVPAGPRQAHASRWRRCHRRTIRLGAKRATSHEAPGCRRRRAVRGSAAIGDQRHFVDLGKQQTAPDAVADTARRPLPPDDVSAGAWLRSPLVQRRHPLGDDALLAPRGPDDRWGFSRAARPGGPGIMDLSEDELIALVPNPIGRACSRTCLGTDRTQRRRLGADGTTWSRRPSMTMGHWSNTTTTLPGPWPSSTRARASTACSNGNVSRAWTWSEPSAANRPSSASCSELGRTKR